MYKLIFIFSIFSISVFAQDTYIVNFYQADDDVQLVVIQQVGEENIGISQQQGDSHTAILIQTGHSNQANIESVGSHTLTTLFQFGDDNIYNSYILNSTSLPKLTTASQLGNQNQIELTFNTNFLPLALTLNQFGDNNMLELQVDSYNKPYMNVTQTGGSKIQITTSAFNFPTQ